MKKARRFSQSIIKTLAGFLVLMMGASAATAGAPSPWQTYFQNAATPIMQQITSFNNFTLWIVTPIVGLVLGLLLFCCLRFNARMNPTPSKTSHNTIIEVIWTTVPVLILVVIAIPSFRLLYAQAEIPPADMTIKATGYQWYWGYEYPDHGDIAFDSYMLQDDERGPDDPRLLAVDNEVVVPVNATVRVLVTAGDVLHAFALPAFGVKMDAVPGRLNETWFQAEREGIYYGQCSELCGRLHGFMPIAVRVVSQEQFDAWAALAVRDLDAANDMLAGLLEQERAQKLARR